MFGRTDCVIAVLAVRSLTGETYALDNIYYPAGALVARIDRPCGGSLDPLPPCDRGDRFGCSIDSRPGAIGCPNSKRVGKDEATHVRLAW